MNPEGPAQTTKSTRKSSGVTVMLFFAVGIIGCVFAFINAVRLGSTDNPPPDLSMPGDQPSIQEEALDIGFSGIREPLLKLIDLSLTEPKDDTDREFLWKDMYRTTRELHDGYNTWSGHNHHERNVKVRPAIDKVMTLVTNKLSFIEDMPPPEGDHARLYFDSIIDWAAKMRE
tara:strand:+ start:359 stop:877 length:519 start_codon:yes stop_codon:yes gene_type:complete